MFQSNEVRNSSWMELEGLKRGLAFLEGNKVTVQDLVTDRHVQVKSYIAKEKKDIHHYFDVWHCAKGKIFFKAGYFSSNFVRILLEHL